MANEVAWVLGTKGILREKTKDSVQYDVPSVRWMGLFDPVHSRGFPMPTFSGFLFMGNRRWCADKIPPNVKSSTVLISQDERRAVFRASELVAGTPTRGHLHSARPMPGAHSDGGGHIENNQVLARIALKTMVEEAVKVDVPVRASGLITPLEIEQARLASKLRPSAIPKPGSERPWALKW